MSDYTGSQFEIIAKAKQALLDSTNIDTSPDEMACLDSFLFRCWQMGWLDKYEKDLVEVVRCRDCEHWECNPGTDRYGSCQKVAYDDFEVVMDAYDFCSYGEKKEQENE